MGTGDERRRNCSGLSSDKGGHGRCVELDRKSAQREEAQPGSIQDRTNLRRNAAEARRLENTLEQPTCIGVFGPSQAGKSYLISVLARREGEEAMIAKFDGAMPEVDFIKSINPLGGEEATGLVTRFTLRGKPAPEGFPVCLRLLSQCDIVKILINSYFQDGDQEYKSAMELTRLEEHIKVFESRCAPSPVDVLQDEDIWDIQEYMTKNASGATTAKAINPHGTR